VTVPPQTLSRTPLLLAFALALAAAVSLGLERFAYALLAPCWFARFDALRVLTAGGLATAAILVAHAFAGSDAPLYALRTLAGVASAATFGGGGLLGARLSARAPHPGVVIGICYGGAGLGIVGSTLLVPPLPWREAWIALGVASLACVLGTWGMTRASRELVQTRPDAAIERKTVAAATVVNRMCSQITCAVRRSDSP